MRIPDINTRPSFGCRNQWWLNMSRVSLPCSCWLTPRLDCESAVVVVVVAVCVGGCGGLTFELLWHHAGVVLKQIPWGQKDRESCALATTAAFKHHPIENTRIPFMQRITLRPQVRPLLLGGKVALEQLRAGWCRKRRSGSQGQGSYSNIFTASRTRTALM